MRLSWSGLLLMLWHARRVLPERRCKQTHSDRTRPGATAARVPAGRRAARARRRSRGTPTHRHRRGHPVAMAGCRRRAQRIGAGLLHEGRRDPAPARRDRRAGARPRVRRGLAPWRFAGRAGRADVRRPMAGHDRWHRPHGALPGRETAAAPDRVRRWPRQWNPGPLPRKSTATTSSTNSGATADWSTDPSRATTSGLPMATGITCATRCRRWRRCCRRRKCSCRAGSHELVGMDTGVSGDPGRHQRPPRSFGAVTQP